MKILSLAMGMLSISMSLVQAYRPAQRLDDLQLRDIVDELDFRYLSARGVDYEPAYPALSRRELQRLDRLALRYLEDRGLDEYAARPIRRRRLDYDDSPWARNGPGLSAEEGESHTEAFNGLAGSATGSASVSKTPSSAISADEDGPPTKTSKDGSIKYRVKIKVGGKPYVLYVPRTATIKKLKDKVNKDLGQGGLEPTVSELYLGDQLLGDGDRLTGITSSNVELSDSPGEAAVV